MAFCAQPSLTSAFIVRDHDGHALAYVYFEDEPGRRSAAHLMTRDEPRRIPVNIAKLSRALRTTGRPWLDSRTVGAMNLPMWRERQP
jgi:hypothetical protein